MVGGGACEVVVQFEEIHHGSTCLRGRFSQNCTTRLRGSLGFELKLVYSLQFVSQFEGPNQPNLIGESKFGCGNCEDQS